MKLLTTKSRGVTLIELSIVLAILGVLIVATISGRSLIDISRATATMQQLRDRSLAFQIFSSTYDCIPGDCLNAGQISGLITYGNGNGDGVINVASATTKNELALVEEHLVKSKLFTRTLGEITVAEPIAAQQGTENALHTILPKAKIANAYISSVSSGGSFYNIVGGFTQENYSTASDLINFSPLPAAVLQIVDSKIDDGLASAGSVTCYNEYTAPTDGVFVLPLETVAPGYTTDCALASKMDF